MQLHGDVLRQAGTVRAFLSETRHRGSGVPRHTHELASFCLVTGGSVAEITRSGRSTYFTSDVIYREPAASHANAFGPEGARCFNVLVEWPLLQRRESESANLRLAAPVLRRLLRELRGPQCPLVTEGLLFQLVGEAFRIQPPQRSLADEASRIVQSRFTTALTVRSVAEELSAHPTALSRAFHQKHGMSIGEAVRALRLRYAEELLRDERRSLAGIAADCGFTDQSHLTNAFRAAKGTTPGKFRRNGA